jgi:ribonuclease E
MLDNEPTGGAGTEQAPAAATNADLGAPSAPTTGRTRRRATRPAGAPAPITPPDPPTEPAATTAEPVAQAEPASAEPAEPSEPVKKVTRTRRRTTKAAAEAATADAAGPDAAGEPEPAAPAGDGDTSPEKAAPRKRTRRKAATATVDEPAHPADQADQAPDSTSTSPGSASAGSMSASSDAGPVDAAADAAASAAGRLAPPPVMFAAPAPVLFVAPTAEELAITAAAADRAAAGGSAGRAGAGGSAAAETAADVDEPEHDGGDDDEDGEIGEDGRRRRRRGRRGRGRGKGGVDDAEGLEHDDETDERYDAGEAGEGETARGRRAGDQADKSDKADKAEKPDKGGRRTRGKGRAEAAEAGGDGPDADAGDDGDEIVDGDGTRRRRRRRRRGGAGDAELAPDDPPNTVVRIREPRKAVDEVQGVSGSTRLEAKRQRRRDGRDQRRTRPAILSESEFLARREAVDRQMVVRQAGDRTQIAVLEDGVLVEHYVAQASGATMVGNVYLGKVQNVLPSMEAAFIDIGRGRNAVLYAGEVNWDAAGLEGRTRAIQAALKPGDAVLVQVTKDPIGHKGARLTSHVTLSGRHLVYVPGGHASGISRKLPDTERKRLRDVLKKLVPEHAGVIVRTAAEGASEDDLARDVTRLQALWETIESKAKTASAPSLLYEEPDLVIRVVRDLFNEDIKDLHIQGEESWEMVEQYVSHVSPDLAGRLHKHTGPADVFTDRRIDEQLMKALDRKVYLPSGGSLVIDRTEAMTVIDVNTGKFIGSGGNLEETVTRNNLEAAEEIVRQLRLRDVGGIIVIDFIDMVLESNRELVLRRLTECLGRDRTKHQVTEITSLGLVQMTRKRLGQPLIDAFSETCEHCKGRGVIIHLDPVAPPKAAAADGGGRSSRRSRKGKADDAEPEVDVIPDEPVETEVSAVVEDTDRDVVEDHELEPEAGGSHRRRRSSSRRRTKAGAS